MLLAVPVALIWLLTSTEVPGLGDWAYAIALGVAIVIAAVLTIFRQTRLQSFKPTESTPGTGAVSGVVLLHGQPVADAKVLAVRAGVEADVESNGTFTLEPLDTGRHVLEVTGSGRRVLRRIVVRARHVTYVKIDLDAWKRVDPRMSG